MKNTLLLLPFSLLLFSCGSKPAATTTVSDTIPVKIMPLEKQGTAVTINASGQFTTDDEVYLSFKTNGIISNILVKEGDKVHKGQLLATLNLTEINAQVQKDQLAFEKAQRDYQRIVRLHNDSVATQEQLENSKTTMDQARQQLSTTQFNRSFSAIHATQDGYVLHKLVSSGQMVNAGTPVLQTNGASSSHWLLRVGVSDREWAQVKNGDKASIEISGIPGDSLTGTVTRKSEGIDAQSGTFLIDVQLTGNKPAAIAAGMFGRCHIHAGAVSGSTAWSIPYASLLDGNGSSGFVFVTNDNKTAQKIPVTIAGMEKENVLISTGMEQAKALIISGSAYLKDQSPIRIIQ
ncbi:RND family efflux transporter, MFP subunit [Chitinophaga ginsengisegetis]|uniref:RND family efflux transporter, MFP subunit n=1 Tax=Chitinophaga ginsengisegetis TaxID=393003 RepID=A0A1T5NAH7_9BACT|nr:efflux RND transporter periplasmic adaptor subunit [Chitinophaga ginsengisegetis]MDR6568371.1 RND family efflux transporter MFP subunit [Chitinophaga ginsengisegetis]MDR6648398.1 RND family efflux transporter MFP subunit [Chitinophaga ginsengisegetis]MDR6654452.1 RND family efflux transporter MFP subunit [Chitinophaga ginsengisegetis]SKC97229.1 RND family efflux transporter, MFP subunit [Chitinophaga ginsengisegetis]